MSTNKWPIIGDDGTVIGIFGISRDVTAAYKMQAELEQHRHHLEALVKQRTTASTGHRGTRQPFLESSADGLYGVDCKGMVTFINPAACLLLGYRPEETIGRSAHALFHHSKPDGSPSRSTSAQATPRSVGTKQESTTRSGMPTAMPCR
ncbi:MAG: PAS domain-containing protein [Dechloromonas sp.]|uniref:PAS domain-containing protein n=1 Tax=Candidatus Dechloromonas phosphorivorans TaxID=2899244 RepID=A0A935K449_9RHOO|nr:PAS domain-containing protein [Candidatus Dechloromonas phosphorivorans]